jgi:hypothetical protein
MKIKMREVSKRIRKKVSRMKVSMKLKKRVSMKDQHGESALRSNEKDQRKPVSRGKVSMVGRMTRISLKVSRRE